ncbi:MAG: hypothetical protein SGARI_004852 [Bacillariaceae sp.]
MKNDYALEQDPSQPAEIDWNARFSATQRTYVYRVLCYPEHHDEDEECKDHGIPFEWDRSWRIRGSSGNVGLDIDAMQEAATHMEGTQDFSTFRGARCQRQSPIVTMKSIRIHSVLPFGVDGNETKTQNHANNPSCGPQLVTLSIVGNSFLYRQVRNMVGCLVDVGKGKLSAQEVPSLIGAKQRSKAPSMAPAHGLFLTDVQHGDFYV